MLGLQVSDPVRMKHPLADGLLRYESFRVGKPSWQIVTAMVRGMRRAIERANVAADRKRPRALCEHRHRRGD